MSVGVAFKAMTKQQIAAKYNVDVRTLVKMIRNVEEIKHLAGKRTMYYFTPKEVELIFKHLGPNE
jgi:uncharacterized protein YbcV (DUF1398 family)